MSRACSLSLLSDRVYNTINDTKEKVKHVGLLHRISSCFTKSSFASCSCDERGQAIDEGARQILAALEEAGKEGYIVGGCVRDLAMGKVPHDWDITTSARPEGMLSIAALRGWKAVDGGGRRFGTVLWRSRRSAPRAATPTAATRTAFRSCATSTPISRGAISR